MRVFSLALPDGTELLMEAPTNLYVPRVLEKNGLRHYEKDTLALALALASNSEGIFVDVGANVGVFSLVVAAVLKRTVRAFEPLPDAAAVISRLAAKCGLPIAVSRIALSDRDGEATFYISSNSDTSSGLNRAFRKPRDQFAVTLARMDELLADQEIGLLKIDTETTEPAVLAGAERLVEFQRPPMIIEVLKNRTEAAIEDFFRGRGYVAYQITSSDRWNPSERIHGDETYRFNNWLFAPEPLTDSIWDSLQHWRARIAECGAARQ